MTENGDLIQVELYRFDPSQDARPYFESFDVPRIRGMRILDALEYIYSELDHTFAFHWFCGAKRCGMCGVTINGQPKLACWEPVETEMRIEPLSHFPVVRDLVVDFNDNEKTLTDLRPVLTESKPYGGFPEPTTHDEMEPHYRLMDCIDCRICVAACGRLDIPGSKFAGPYALVQLAKVALHPRNQRDLSNAILSTGIEECLSCNDCTVACPSNIPILTGAIDELRDVLVRETEYRIHGWTMIRKMPAWLRRLLRCTVWGSFVDWRQYRRAPESNEAA